MKRGWVVLLKDGTKIKEKEMQWKNVPKKEIEKLLLLFDGRKWEVSDKEAYFVNTRASMVPGMSHTMEIEERSIGWYEGANKISYVVNERTGGCELRVKDNSK
jgi:hypothetical protein